jgi:hypothetical protein
MIHMIQELSGRTLSAQLWRSAVTDMNNVKIVVASLRVTLSQVRERFGGGEYPGREYRRGEYSERGGYAEYRD